MNKIGLIAAATIAAIAAPAMAQTVTTRTTTVHRETGYHTPVVVVRQHRRKVCTVRTYNHRKVRRCAWR